MRKKKHHFIPKFVLKNFTENGKIYQYRHDSKKTFEVSINDAFTKSKLNTLTDTDGNEHPNFIEDIYDKYFENPSSSTIKKIITDLDSIPPSGKDFTANDYLNLLRFAILSNFRTPYTMSAAHHAARVSAYGMIYFKYFMDFGTVDFPYDLDVEKGLLFSHLENFDEATKLLVDLKLTLYYHRVPNSYFLIPDQFVVLSSPNNSKFADKDLKIYFPISNNVVVCLERIKRNFAKATCEIDKENIEKINQYFLNNSYDSVGCSNKSYLDKFISGNYEKITPLKKFNPYENFTKVKQQIKFEIVSKLVMNIHPLDFNDGIITHINRNHEFKILTETEFEEARKKLNSTVDIKKRILKI